MNIIYHRIQRNVFSFYFCCETLENGFLQHSEIYCFMLPTYNKLLFLLFTFEYYICY